MAVEPTADDPGSAVAPAMAVAHCGVIFIAEKQIVICEILRRVETHDLPPLADEGLVANAEELFLELDHREALDV